MLMLVLICAAVGAVVGFVLGATSACVLLGTRGLHLSVHPRPRP